TQVLADALAAQIQQDFRDGRLNVFTPVTVMVPHRNLGTWLSLRLADRFQVAAGLEFDFMEKALWDLLLQADRTEGTKSRLNASSLQKLILSLLMKPGFLKGAMEP